MSAKLVCLDGNTEIFKVDSGGSITTTLNFVSSGTIQTSSTTGTTSFLTPTTITNTTNSLNSTTGALVISGGLSINGGVNATSNTVGGALTVNGGGAISGDLYIGGTLIGGGGGGGSTFSIINLTSTTNATNSSTGALRVVGGIGVGGSSYFGSNITVLGTVDGRDISVDGSALDNLTTTIGLSALTSVEVDQLENINSTVISTTQWGYIGGLDQGLATTNNVQFNTAIIDATSTTALVVRQNGGGSTIFNVDTTNSNIYFGASTFYAQDVTTPLLNFDTGDYLEYDRTLNEYRFRVGGTSRLEISGSKILANATKLEISGGISGAPSSVGKYLSIPASTFTDNTTTTSGTASIVAFNEFSAPTLSALNPSITTTNTATVYIGGSPIAGSNQTITNGYALWVDGGDVRIDDNVVISGGLTALNAGVQAYGFNASNNTSTPVGTFGIGGRSATGGTSGGFMVVQGNTFTDNTTTTSGTLNAMAFVGIGIPTLSALNPSVTTTNATTLYIGGAPTTGSNETITNKYAMWINAGDMRIDGNIIISGAVDGRDISVDGTTLDNINANGISALTTAEVDQLENINSTVISTTQWGYIGGLDQSLSTTNDVQFNTAIIDATSTTALLVRQNGGGSTVLSVDTTNSRINFVDTSFYATLSGVIPSLQFDTNDNILYDRTANQFRFTIDNTSTFEIVGARCVVVPTTQISNTTNNTGTFGSALNVNGDIITPRLYTYSTSLNAPTFTTRSVGSRIVLATNTSASTTDYSLGLDTNVFWASVPTTSETFKWYGGTTQLMSLTGTSLTLDVTEIIDITSTVALVVRKNGNSGDIFNVDTSSNITTSTDIFHIRPTSSGNESSVTFYANSDKSISVAGDKYTMGHNANSIGTKNWSLSNNIGNIINCMSDRTVILPNTTTSISVTTGALQVVGGIGIGGNSIFGGTVNGRNITTDGSALDNLVTTIGLSALTTAEVDQLENINSTVISTTQWGYLGALDQGLTKTSNVTFGNIATPGTVDGRDISVDGSALDNLVTTIGLSALTSVEVDQLENINSTVISTTQWGYLGGLDQGLATTNNVQFNTAIIDATSTTALLVRQNGGGSTIFSVNTTDAEVRFGGGSTFYAQDTTNPLLNFDTGDYIDYDRTLNEYRFRVGGTSRFEISGSKILANATKLEISGSISGAPSSVGKYLSIPASTFTDNTTTTSGTATIVAFNEFSAPTLSALNPSITTTNTATVYIGGSPIAGSNQTIINGYAMWVDNGGTRLDGDVICNAGLTALGTYIQSWGLITTNVEDSTSTTTGTITTAGGVGIVKSVNIGGIASIKSTVESTTTSTGSLIISGGVGITKDVRIGGSLYIGGTQLTSGVSTQASFTAANNQSSSANVTGLLFTGKSSKVWLTVIIDATTDLYEFFELSILNKGATWVIYATGEGDDSLVDFSITSGGQIQYTSGNISGHISTIFYYKYIEIV